MICPHCSGYIRDNRRGEALPERVVEALQAALPLARSRGANRPANPNQARFNGYLFRLHHEFGYTLAAVADVLGMTRQAVDQRVNNASPADCPSDLEVVDGVPLLVLDPPPLILTEGIVAELAELQAKACQVNGATLADDSSRKASVCLAKKLAELHGAGATYTELAAVLGVTKEAVRARLQRHGYRSTPPSMAHYTGLPTRRIS